MGVDSDDRKDTIKEKLQGAEALHVRRGGDAAVLVCLPSDCSAPSADGERA